MQASIFFAFLALAFSFNSFQAVAQDSTQTGFKPGGKIWGYAFGDYAYKLHADKELRGNIQYSGLAQDYNSFNFRRIYLGYDYQFTPHISSQFLLAHESSAEGNPNNPDVLSNGNRGVYIKAMNLRFKNVIPRATIVVGQQSTPTFATLADGIWGYRSIEKTIADMRGISSSTDLGIGVFGRIGKNENLGYELMVGNNNGAKLENNNFKKLYTSLYVYLFHKKVVVQGNYETAKTALSPVPKNSSTFRLFAAYKTPATTVGVEAFTQVRSNNNSFLRGVADTAFTDAQASGISFFVTQQLVKEKLRAFARLDAFTPDQQYKADRNYLGGYNTNNELFATIGLDYMPHNNIHIMPNIWLDQFQNKAPGATGALKKDYDFVGRITLYFLFNR